MHELRLNICRLLRASLCAVALSLLSGCAAARLDPAAWQDSSLGAVWPQPPEKARVRLLRVLQGPESVGMKEKGVISSLLSYFSDEYGDLPGFYTPHCIAADGNGLIYIADASLGVVHRYDLAAREVSYISQAGSKKLGSPVGLALDNEGNLYVTDAQLAALFKFDRKGNLLGEVNSGGRFKRPAGIALTSRGDKVVADMLANKVFIFAKDDTFKYELPGPDFTSSLNMPSYVAVDRGDTIYVTDPLNFTVRIFDSEGKFLRNQGQIGDSPGSFARPKGVAVDSDRNLYVLDAIFGNFQMFNQKGQLLLYVGQEGGLPGEMMLPSGIFIDRDDRIYVSDTFNHRIQIFQYLKEGAP